MHRHALGAIATWYRIIQREYQPLFDIEARVSNHICLYAWARSATDSTVRGSVQAISAGITSKTLTGSATPLGFDQAIAHVIRLPPFAQPDKDQTRAMRRLIPPERAFAIMEVGRYRLVFSTNGKPPARTWGGPSRL